MSEVLTGEFVICPGALRDRAVRVTIITVMPAQAGIQYAVKARSLRNGAEYWITRLRG